MTDPSLRLDKWLWYARFFKTRSLATGVCNAGRLRIGGEIVSNAHHKVHPGDILTFPQGRQIRVVKILALAGRRGPAPEAQALYEDLSPPSKESRLPRDAALGAVREPGSGRPTKRDRRALEKIRGGA
jgi:ribosome-associated heat shock protein Hsp15